MISRTIHSTNRNNAGKLFKGLVAIVTLLIYFVFFSYIPNHIHTVHSSISICRASLQFLHCLFAQWDNLPGVPGPRFELGPALQLTSALYQLSNSAPLLSYAAHTFLLSSYLPPIPLPLLSRRCDHGSPLPSLFVFFSLCSRKFRTTAISKLGT
jgi:hypothetical protein